MRPRYYLLTLGCPKNTVDSEGMGELLRRAGYEECDSPGCASILIVNTCGFIGPAKEESLSALRKLAAGKAPSQLLVAAGCLAQRYGEGLRQSVPGLDGILGTRRWTQIADLVDAWREGRAPSLSPTEPGLLPPIALGLPRCPALGASVYLKIADGCDAPCAFCAIPSIKGPQESKPLPVILREARELVSVGAKEIILIAQDTTAYGRDLNLVDGLPALVESILETAPELPWLRIMYAYPQHITERLAETMARHPQVCHYLDLPLQHAHPDTLRRMRRPHNLEAVWQTIRLLRAAMPDITFRTAFIVGYPGETDEEFQALLQFMEEAAFDRVGIFSYSREEGTLAAHLPGQVPEEVKEERRERAMALAREVSRRKNREFIGKELQVLIEGSGEGLSVGRSYRDAPEVDGMVLVKGEFPVGEFLPVKVTAALDYDLLGEGAGSPPSPGGAV